VAINQCNLLGTVGRILPSRRTMIGDRRVPIVQLRCTSGLQAWLAMSEQEQFLHISCMRQRP
jgi:hypothetical protein